jgi:hypothetical protein
MTPPTPIGRLNKDYALAFPAGKGFPNHGAAAAFPTSANRKSRSASREKCRRTYSLWMRRCVRHAASSVSRVNTASAKGVGSECTGNVASNSVMPCTPNGVVTIGTPNRRLWGQNFTLPSPDSATETPCSAFPTAPLPTSLSCCVHTLVAAGEHPCWPAAGERPMLTRRRRGPQRWRPPLTMQLLPSAESRAALRFMPGVDQPATLWLLPTGATMYTHPIWKGCGRSGGEAATVTNFEPE